MRNLLCFFVVILFFSSCNKERKVNHFDEITHYFISDEIASKSDTIERFNEIFTSVYGHKINFQTFEKELVSYGYRKTVIPKEKVKKIDEFITNDIYYESHLTACVPMYRDILILKKNNKIVCVLKLCFECSMIDKYGAIESNYGEDIDFENYFINFENFHKTLHGKDFSR